MSSPWIFAWVLGAMALPLAGQTELWVASYDAGVSIPVSGYPGSGELTRGKKSIAVDGAGNTYVTGRVQGAVGGQNYGTAKYDPSGAQLWLREYNGSGNGNDYAYAVAVDGSGNVYVTGKSRSATNDDFATVKYDTAGTELWARTYNGSGNNLDYAYAVAVDGSGNVYVTGQSYGVSGGWNFATVKYSAAGTQVWVREYNGTGNNADYAYAVGVDGSGNVYVAGPTYGSSGSWNYGTVKYDAAGNQLWAREFNGSGNNSDSVYDMVVDGSGNTYVTGNVFGSTGGHNYGTVKYDAAGNQLWAREYNGPGNSTDYGQALAVDGSGNVVVTGRSYNAGSGGWNYGTVKYDAAGTQLWSRDYNGNGNNADHAYAVTVDGSGNAYVNGHTINANGNWDYGTVKYNSAGTQQWVQQYNGSGNGHDYSYGVAVDASGNARVTGYSWTNTGVATFLTLNYRSSDGVALWNATSVRGGSDRPGAGDFAHGKKSLAVDAAGNTYVTGGSQNSSGRWDYSTVKYDSAGNELWARQYNGSGNGDDYAYGIAVDGAGSVYITGRVVGSTGGVNFATVKYDGAGNQLWAREYNGSANSSDYGYFIDLDSSGSVYVTGATYGTSGNSNYGTVKYDSAGNQLWAREFNGAANNTDWPRAMTVDAAGNVVVTGNTFSGSNYDYGTVKYDGAGNQLWARQVNLSGNIHDYPYAVTVDGSGNVYVTGYGAGSSGGTNYGTVKYDAAGNQQWVREFNGAGNNSDYGRDVAVDASGNVYVTGQTYHGGTDGWNYGTLKYDAAGSLQWSREFNGSGNSSDDAWALALDGSGNAYVTGDSRNSLGNEDYVTLKYDPSGTELWNQVYDGAGNGDDVAYAIALDGSGNAYVTGRSDSGFDEGENFVTIKYGANLDFGDAPDGPYPTTLASNGARHTLGSGLFLGALVDGEADGQPNATATGDDTGGSDDEDGVIFTSALVSGVLTTLDVTASGAGRLDAWVDFNGNGSWSDLGERVFTGQVVASGTNNLSFTAPGTASPGITTFARFRLSSAGVASFDSAAPDGEVEDYQVVIENPSIAVTKGVTASTISEPSALVGFTVSILNDGTVPVTLTSLVDDVHGNLHGQGNCAMPQTLPVGGLYGCGFNATVSGNAGYVETDTITASGVGAGAPVVGADSATVTVTDRLPSLTVVKTATPTSIPEPGGLVTFTVQVANTSVTTDPLTLQSLTDNIHGDLNGQGTCLTGVNISSGSSYNCSFTATVSGGAGASEIDIVTASGIDDEGNVTGGSDSETVTITDQAPAISVTKTASPLTVVEPGGTVTFGIDVINNSGPTDPVILETLIDDIHGNLHGQGTCSVGGAIGPGSTYTCSFTATVNGNAGDTETDTVTATVTDDEGTGTSAFDSATVTVTGVDWGDAPDPTYPTRAASSGASHTILAGFFLGAGVDADPDGQPDAGATGDDLDGNDDENGVSFTSLLAPGVLATLDVTASAAGVLDAWVDFDGNGAWEVGEKVFDGLALAAGVNSLSFTVPIAATSSSSTFARFRLTASGIANPTGPALDGEVEDYEVAIENPSIAVTKTAAPTTVTEPGGLVVFSVGVLNDGSAPVSLASLVDDVHGDLNGQGNCSVPQTITVGATYSCTFIATVNGNAGDSEIDTVTAAGTSAGAPVSDSDTATVAVLGSPPSITVTKTASPITLPEPGGLVSFTVLVMNTSALSDPVTLQSLGDDIHGDLNAQGTCSVPQVILPGGSYSCSFSATVSGNAGDSETDTVTASGQDDDGAPVSGSDSATVTIYDIDPSISVTKTASPTTVVEPGGNVTFTVEVTNTSATSDPVTLLSLVDDVHGDLNGQGTCATGGVIPPGSSYSCSFTVMVNGNAGDTETDTVTANVEDDDGASTSGSDSATVTVVGVDWGDAPDPTYPTLAASGGASHNILAGFYLGASVDAEPDGQPDATATGDDLARNDDEDGVVFTDVWVPGYVAHFEVTNSLDGILDAWVDFNGDGDWNDAGEKVFDGEFLPAATHGLGVPVPSGATLGSTFARFRLSSTGVADPTGPAIDGEVEDYEITIEQPSIAVSKQALPTAVAEPGGAVTFTVTVLNDGTTPVTLTSLTDDVHGDLNGQGSCALPQTLGVGANYSCAFSAIVSGNAGDTETDTVTADGTGAGIPVTDAASATVTILGVDPSITVSKTASPTNLPEPGGNVTFTVVVTNTSVASDPVTVTGLGDDIHGDLNGQGSCATGGVIPPGGNYSCAFTVAISGSAGDSETDTVTANVLDDDGVGATGSDSATVTITDGIPPQVAAISHFPTSGDSTLLDCETVRETISTFEIGFDEAMYDPLGDTDADDVTNPLNYLLVEAGADRSLQTAACGGAQGDDTGLALSGVTYNGVNFTATLSAGSLGDGLYRIFACGSTTLTDEAGNPLDGDGNGTGGDDFWRTFRVDERNLFENGHFDCTLDSWVRVSTNPSEIFHSGEDVDSSTDSGSTGVSNLTASTDFAIGQCVEVRSGGVYQMGVKASLDLPVSPALGLTRSCESYDGVQCGGSVLGAHADTTLFSDTGGAWATIVGEFSVPVGSVSALCTVEIAAASGESFDAHLDQVYLREQYIFRDGFESGDTSAWSATQSLGEGNNQ